MLSLRRSFSRMMSSMSATAGGVVVDDVVVAVVVVAVVVVIPSFFDFVDYFSNCAWGEVEFGGGLGNDFGDDL